MVHHSDSFGEPGSLSIDLMGKILNLITYKVDTLGGMGAPLIINPIWMFPKIGVPQNGWFRMENPITRWWQLKHFLFSPRKLGKMNPF